MKKRIGILGGISLVSTIKYFKTITDLYFEKFKDYYYPEIIIYSLDFQRFTDMENEKRTKEYINYIVSSNTALEKAGADFIIMAANSPHSVFEEVKKLSKLPIISIVDATAKYALKNNLKKTLLTGIKYTMQSDFYPKGFEKSSLEVVKPGEEHQTTINEIIFTELVIDKFLDESRKQFVEIISSYDVDGVILACTELPLLLDQNDTKIKLLNSALLHCQAALEFSLSLDEQ